MPVCTVAAATDGVGDAAVDDDDDDEPTGVVRGLKKPRSRAAAVDVNVLSPMLADARRLGSNRPFFGCVGDNADICVASAVSTSTCSDEKRSISGGVRLRDGSLPSVVVDVVGRSCAGSVPSVTQKGALSPKRTWRDLPSLPCATTTASSYHCWSEQKTATALPTAASAGIVRELG
jgi:hypothetical protein